MVINDDQSVADDLTLTLDPNKFHIHSTSSLFIGQEEITQQNPDVVIIESQNLQGDSFQICRKLREYCQVPILVMSIFEKPGIIEEALNAGADEYLLKPVPANVLAAYLNTFARRSRAEKEAVNTINRTNYLS